MLDSIRDVRGCPVRCVNAAIGHALNGSGKCNALSSITVITIRSLVLRTTWCSVCSSELYHPVRCHSWFVPL